MDKIDILSMNKDELSAFFKEAGEPAFRADQIFSWLHEKMVESFSEMTNIKKELRESLNERAFITAPEVLEVHASKDGTKKFLLRLSDGVLIESVLMVYEYGASVCVSTQAGCAMGCMFCASGKGGLERNLTPGEIIGQIYAIGRNQDMKIGRLVFMGMGEPLLNYDNVIKAIRLLTDPKGADMSPRHMTLSTCGIVPGIRALAQENLPITLALSLHSAIQIKREGIMPISSKYPLDEVLAACKEYRKTTGRRLTYEYCLMPGVNDGDEDVEALIKLLKGSDTHLNVIAVHTIEEVSFAGSADPLAFKNKLEKNGINVTIRRELGQDIDASCGQLRSRKKRSTV